MTETANPHGAHLTVDLGALTDNWRLLDGLARAKTPSAKAGAVVKADAYGTGIAQAVPALSKAGCSTFFVAHLGEAIAARAAAPQATIYVLNGLPAGATAAYRHANLRPVLGSLDELQDWGASGPFALHIDTGMNRLGFSFSCLRELDAGTLKPALVMTHFAASEVPEDVANAAQIAAFAEIASHFPDAPKSLLNSSGHFLRDAAAYDITRPGYALYGGNPTPGQPNPMKPVIRLEAPIVQVRDVTDGTAIGYNGKWVARGPRRLVTISVGYADGYPRNATATTTEAGGYALVGGTLCSFVGSVSMDLIILDVTEAPASAVQRGAPVTLIGGTLDIDRVGTSARTIGYEMLTSLGKRYQRHYIGG